METNMTENANEKRGNFDFLRDDSFARKLKAALYSAEAYLKTDLVHAGYLLRKAIELFVDGVCQENRLALGNDNVIWRERSIGNKIKALRENRVIDLNENVGDFPEYSYADSYFQRRSGKTFWFPVENGRKFSHIYRGKPQFNDGSRRGNLQCALDITNECVHTYQYPDEFKRELYTFDRLLTAFSSFRQVLHWYYFQRIEENTPDLPKYDIDMIRQSLSRDQTLIISANGADRNFRPMDADFTGCEKEYQAYAVIGDGKAESQFAIIRQYRKTEANDWELLVNRLNAVQNTINGERGYRPNFIEVRELNALRTSVYTDFHQIAYIFHSRPQFLVDVLPGITDIAKRLRICLRIAELFEYLHGSADSRVRIFHRFLTYDCVTIDCDSGEYYPDIIRFDFAKILERRSEDYGSLVLVKAIDAFKYIEKMDGKYKKYFAPEWKCFADPEKGDVQTARADWEAIDVFSLGVLFCDIIKGEISQKLNLKNLNGKISQNLADALMYATKYEPGERTYNVNASILKAQIEKESKRF